MPKKPTSVPKPRKRNLQSSNNHQESQTIKKPRKVVKQNTQVSHQESTKKSQSPMNFYETIPEVPTYHLSKEQMKDDPINLLNQLQEKYAHFGAVKIVVNDSWNSPFTFRYVDKEITTRIQCLSKLKDGKVTFSFSFSFRGKLFSFLLKSHIKAFEQKVRAYRIQAYEAMAQNFSRQYRYKSNPQGIDDDSKDEQQYWNLVSNPEYEKKPVTVEYAADLSASVYGSGFPVQKMTNWIDADFEYQKNYWNLNNISKSPSSLLRICEKRKQKISGISYPWLYMGMKFSTFCWHVEDLYLNSINYNHKGSTKTWYVVPGSQKEKFDDFVQKRFEGNSKKKNILEKIILMIDPKELIEEGIQVYKVNQRPREYVCTFFKAYHAGFSHGFNVGQAVNFLSPKSLKYINQGEKLYNYLQRSKDYKPKALVLSKQWLIYENIDQGKINLFKEKYQSYLRFEYQKMLQQQQLYLKEQLVFKKKIDSINSTKKVNILPNDTKYEKLGCQHCKNYIYLSAIECTKCGILCPNHIDRCHCGYGTNKYEIWIRQPNQDRSKYFMDYPIIVKALQEFKIRQKKEEYERSRSLGQAKSLKSREGVKSLEKIRARRVGK